MKGWYLAELMENMLNLMKLFKELTINILIFQFFGCTVEF